jgi:hypothetical protein
MTPEFNNSFKRWTSYFPWIMHLLRWWKPRVELSGFPRGNTPRGESVASIYRPMEAAATLVSIMR